MRADWLVAVQGTAVAATVLVVVTVVELAAALHSYTPVAVAAVGKVKIPEGHPCRPDDRDSDQMQSVPM